MALPARSGRVTGPPTPQAALAADLPVVRSHTDPDTVVVSLHGAVGEHDGTQLRRVLVQAIVHTRPHRIVVDLTHATALDPTSLGALLAARDSAPDLHITLAVAHPSPALAAQLHDCGLTIAA